MEYQKGENIKYGMAYLRRSIVAHEGAKAVIRNIKNRILPLGHVGNVDVVGGWANVLVFAVSENVDSNDVRLGVAVLSSLGGADVSNFAGAAVDYNVATFANEARLHGKGGGGTGIGSIDGKVLILLWHVLFRTRHVAKAFPERLARRSAVHPN
jgi:hypothetical protein